MTNCLPTINKTKMRPSVPTLVQHRQYLPALSLLSLGIILLGLLALVIGVVLALPLIQMMLATAYLMMKGELKPVEA